MKIEVYDDSKVLSSNDRVGELGQDEEEIGLEDLIVRDKTEQYKKPKREKASTAGPFINQSDKDKEGKDQNTTMKDSKPKASTLIEPRKTGDSSLKSYSLSKSKVNEKEVVDIKGPISNEMFFSMKTTPLLDDYESKDKLGEGSFGEVKLMVHKKTRVERAVKIIKKHKLNKEEKEQMMMEVSILKTLDHPNIIKIFDVYEDHSHLYLVTE